MDIKTGKGFGGLADKAMSFLEGNTGLMQALGDCNLSVGFDSEPGFGVPANALDDPLFMGDSGLVGEKQISRACEAMLKKNPDKVQLHPVWNEQTKRFDTHFSMSGDEGFDPLAGQLFSPWNITYMSKIWKEPLAYSNAKELIRTERAGSNPFAELFTLFLEQYAGWGAIGQTGTFQNNMTNDVNVRNGMASFPIINMMGTYSVTLREKEQKAWGPMQTSPLTRKQSYLNYVMDMMDDILRLYGNEETNTPGLLDVNPIKVWTGDSIKKTYLSTTDTHRGSTLFRQLAALVNDFLTRADNKYGEIVIGMSPEAYNYLLSTPYSDTFSAEAALRTFSENYLAGKGPGHTTPTIKWVAEPLLKASSSDSLNPVNPNPFDYVIISAPTIGGGPENQRQSTNFYATVLDKFVFPVIPGMYNSQYKTLRRTAGVIAPIPSAVEVYAGLGVAGDE